MDSKGGHHHPRTTTKGSLGSLGTMDCGGDLTTLQNLKFSDGQSPCTSSAPDFLRPFPPQEEPLTIHVQKSKISGIKVKDFKSCQFSLRITGEAICIVRAAMRDHHRLDAFNNRKVSSHRFGGWRQTCRQGWFLPRPLSLACRWATFFCVLAWPFLCLCTSSLAPVV